MKLTLFIVFVIGIAIASPIPSENDNTEINMLSLSESASPKFYESEAEAIKAAESELALLGESAEGSQSLKSIAEKEALQMAQNAAQDPMHDGMEGMKVNLGEIEDPEEKARQEKQEKQQQQEEALKANSNKIELEPEQVQDLQNEQKNKPQFSDSDIPVATHSKPKTQSDLIKNLKVSKIEKVSDESHLLSDEGNMIGSTRPSAPQYGSPQMPFSMPMGQMPQMMGQMPQMMGQMPQMQMPQMPQMQMPQMPMAGQMPQMPMMGQMPQMPMMGQMPNMYLQSPDLSQQHSEEEEEKPQFNAHAQYPFGYMNSFAQVQSPQLQNMNMMPTLSKPHTSHQQRHHKNKKSHKKSLEASTTQDDTPQMNTLPQFPQMNNQFAQISNQFAKMNPQFEQMKKQFEKMMSQMMPQFSQMMPQSPQMMPQFSKEGNTNTPNQRTMMMPQFNMPQFNTQLEGKHHQKKSKNLHKEVSTPTMNTPFSFPQFPMMFPQFAFPNQQQQQQQQLETPNSEAAEEEKTRVTASKKKYHKRSRHQDDEEN